MTDIVDKVQRAIFDRDTVSDDINEVTLLLNFHDLCDLRRNADIGRWDLQKDSERFMGYLVTHDNSLARGEIKWREQ
jgi:hypothetical protein